jgi:hypothetical protein
MKNLSVLDPYRLSSPEIIRHYGNAGDSTCGVFQFYGLRGEPIRVIASSGEGWDHVSVSLEKRCPSWDEMERFKRLFFKEDETAMQLHVPADDHISHHPFCLHLWRPTDEDIPRPPDWMVGPKKTLA